jgi:release factor glutamine methyltransferase
VAVCLGKAPVSSSLSDSARSAIVSKLRAAGCVFAEDEARLLIAAASDPAELDAMVARRVGGEPLEYVLGFGEFCGLRVAVEPGVFVPRRRSEFLVAQALDGVRPGAVVVDMCCGSGAIGVAVVTGLQRAELHAVDIDPVAVRCARRNVTADRAQVYEGDLYEPLPISLRGRVDVLVANAPYVPTDEIDLLPAEARVYEARIALDGGSDGLDIQRRVSAAAPQWLAPAGRLLIETSERQAAATTAMVARAGLTVSVATSEDLDATVVIGSSPN